MFLNFSGPISSSGEWNKTASNLKKKIGGRSHKTVKSSQDTRRYAGNIQPVVAGDARGAHSRCSPLLQEEQWTVMGPLRCRKAFIV